MPQPRKYASNADRQAAYRRRVKAREAERQLTHLEALSLKQAEQRGIVDITRRVMAADRRAE